VFYHNKDQSDFPISRDEFLTKYLLRYTGKNARLCDPYFEHHATLSRHYLEDGGDIVLVFTQVRRKPRFTSGAPITQCADAHIRVCISAMLSLVEGKTRCYIALLPSVNHIYLG
jgi:hypothetical protein